MRKNFGIIYKAKFENGKVYIGQTTKSLKSRKNQHLSELHKENVIFHSAIIKYGENFVEWSVIDTADDIEELNLMEIYWISYYNSYIHTKDSNGYNMTFGGDYNPMYGKHHTKKTKNKISKTKLGITLSEETKKKMSKSRMGENNPNYGKHFSEETKRKLSEANSGEKWHKSKLTKKQVFEILDLYHNKKYTQREISKLFPVGERTIGGITHGNNWKSCYDIFMKKQGG